jgi:hypothetical protein
VSETKFLVNSLLFNFFVTLLVSLVSPLGKKAKGKRENRISVKKFLKLIRNYIGWYNEICRDCQLGRSPHMRHQAKTQDNFVGSFSLSVAEQPKNT